MKIALKALQLFVALPIWFFLMYTLLQAAHVDRLVWFLFWIYMPLVFVIGFAEKMEEIMQRKERQL